MADKFSVTGDGLARLALDLEGAAKALIPETSVTLTEIGTLVKNRAHEIARSYTPRGKPTSDGSTREKVANSIHGHLQNAATYRITYGEGVPLAGLWELGNAGARASEHTFRHPLFGDKNHWYPQPRHPFMAPAIDENAGEIERIAVKTWDRALIPYGLRPEGTSLLVPAFPGAPVGRAPAGAPGGTGGQFISFSSGA